jgi:hypothetical protein
MFKNIFIAVVENVCGQIIDLNNKNKMFIK